MKTYLFKVVWPKFDSVEVTAGSFFDALVLAIAQKISKGDSFDNIAYIINIETQELKRNPSLTMDFSS